jgi:hypothetical protein
LADEPGRELQKMIKLMLLYAVALIVVGAGGYEASGRASWTALIPAFLGAVLVVLGVLARFESWRKPVLYAGWVLALLGFAATVMGIPAAVSVIAHGGAERPLAALSRAATAVLSLTFVVLCAAYFLKTRRSRES